jgi:imidazolonepropionase-like amidohydrolase
MDIMREGGGIGFTVEQTRLATDEDLLALLVSRLKRMLAAGESTLLSRSLFIPA